MGLRVGIDLGTTYCAVAYVDDDGRPRIIENSAGERTTPSVLCFREDGRVLFGEEAKELQESGEANTASFYKRNMGESSYGVCLGGKPRTPEDLSATFLQLLVEDAEKAIGQSIDSAVITVPAYFAARERQATINAGKRAGLEVIALLNEPSAAAYAYGLVGGGAARQTVLIYDLGGGTFDATVACIDEQEVRVLGSGGNHKLGGKDWDDALARYMIEVMCDELDVDSATLILSTQEMNALIVQAEQVKRQLSSRARVRVRITAGGESAVVEVSRADFENVTAHLLHATIDVVEELLSECDLSWRDIDGTILVGGSTRMPGVEGFLKEATGKRPLAGVNPDESVAIGAAIRANAQIRMQAEERRLGVVEKPLPTLPGLKRLVDATAHAMGMIAESADRSRYVNSVMIPKNSPVPACKEKDYTLRVPDAGGIFEVYVLQGENERVLDNAVFAKYIISDIQRENGAESIVTVSYRYTENATIEVAARQNGLGRDLEVCEAEIDEDLSRFDGPPPSLEESSGKTNLRVTIAIDVSGSMSGSPLEEAKRAIKEFLATLEGTNAEIGLTLFADRNKVVCYPTSQHAKVLSALNGVSIGRELGACNAAEPIGYWFQEVYKDTTFSFRKHMADTHDWLIVLTDGMWETQSRAIESAAEVASAGADIMAIGFGSADRSFLKKIATRDDFAAMTELSHLRETFSTIGRAMASGNALRAY